MSTSPAVQIAIDIGGTFTDGVAWSEDTSTIVVGKSLTTPSDPGEAVSTVLQVLIEQLAGTLGVTDLANARVIHGTTLVTNTLVERKGAHVALIVNQGTEDTLDIRRELRYDTYDLHAEYPKALVDREHRYGISARLGPDGSEWAPLDEAELAAVITRIAESDVEAVGVCLLHAPANEAHERQIEQWLNQKFASLPVSVSVHIAREIGEYERMSTVAANAYVQPIVSSYLAKLTDRMQAQDVGGALHIMLSNGAFTTSQIASDAPIRILESGPAGGVLSAINCARGEDISEVLAFDMGGTTAKACVAVDAKPSITHVFEFGRVRRFRRGSGLPAVSPSIDLIEIGAGGGSLATVSELGLLQVGPQSAGAEPGPACYGLGGVTPTVTDADLALGYLDANNFLGGTMTLDVHSAQRALGALASQLNMDTDAVAWGIHDVVNENMAAAARTHIAEQGLDARKFSMVATGGAGPVHAVDVARRLGITRILVPVASGVGSCLGFIAAPARADRSWSRVELLEAIDAPHFTHEFDVATESITSDLASCGIEFDAIEWRFSAEIRYVGQGNTVEVELPKATATQALDSATLKDAFETVYKSLYHKTVPGGVPEVVTWRLSGRSPYSLKHFSQPTPTTAVDEAIESRTLYLTDARRYDTVRVYARATLKPGQQLPAPLVITEPESTLIVARNGMVTVADSGTLVVDIASTN